MLAPVPLQGIVRRQILLLLLGHNLRKISNAGKNSFTRWLSCIALQREAGMK
jgi:hypothetical protein